MSIESVREIKIRIPELHYESFLPLGSIYIFSNSRHKELMKTYTEQKFIIAFVILIVRSRWLRVTENEIKHGTFNRKCTGWAEKKWYLSYITLHCTRGIRFLAHPVYAKYELTFLHRKPFVRSCYIIWSVARFRCDGWASCLFKSLYLLLTESEIIETASYCNLYINPSQSSMNIRPQYGCRAAFIFFSPSARLWLAIGHRLSAPLYAFCILIGEPQNVQFTKPLSDILTTHLLLNSGRRENYLELRKTFRM